MFEQTEILDRQRHAGLRFAVSPSFSFAADQMTAPIVVGEFSDLAKHYMIVFVREPGGNIMPTVLLGVQARQNLYLDAKGGWDVPYIPLQFRRYPFIFAENLGNASSTPEGERREFLLAFDPAAPQWVPEGEGEPLFDENGAPSALITSVMQLLEMFQHQVVATLEFTAALDKSGCLVDRQIEIALANGGERYGVNEFLVVDNVAYGALANETRRDWEARGWLLPLYAHWISLGNANALASRLGAVQGVAMA
jgi:hypothetical protein